MKLIGVTNLNISKIGILGAGVMGPGIAEVFAIFGASHNFNIFICAINYKRYYTPTYNISWCLWFLIK